LLLDARPFNFWFNPCDGSEIHKGTVIALVGVMHFALGAAGQSLLERHIPQSQSEMHTRVIALYNFHPSKVSDDERKAKSKEMDIFWDEMKAKPEITLPLLRAELLDESDPAFFVTDGAELLSSLSQTIADKQLIGSVLPRVDLNDTQSGSYFYMVHTLACDGIDVTKAALHVLDEPRFKVSVPQHAMTLDLTMSLMYLLLSMKEDLWVKAAVDRFSTESSLDAKVALVSALFYAQTDESDAALTRIAADTNQPEAVRDEAKTLLAEARKTAKSVLPIRGTVLEIRAQRRKRLQAVSDEAIDDVQWMTRKIAQLRAKGKG
jgi:hypothetical protein